MRRRRGSGPIAQQRRMAMALNPRGGGRSRPVSPFGHPGPDIVVSTPVDPFASTNTCPPGWVWRRNSVGGWDCSPSVLAAQGPTSNPTPIGAVSRGYVTQTPWYPLMNPSAMKPFTMAHALRRNPYVGAWPWGRGGWGSWRAPVPQSYGVQGGPAGYSASVGPGPGAPIAFPGPYESPEQAATVAASYIGSRGGYPFGG